MSELKDPKIKLFGKTIELPETSANATATVTIGDSSAQPCDTAGEDFSNQDPTSSSDSMLEDLDEQESEKSLSSPKQTASKDEHKAQLMTSEDLKASNVTPPIKEDEMRKTTNVGEAKNLKNEEDQSHEKTLKKPDKIVPCPRCNSMDTKFCYFNNYNVNQPRHFCKNCQRYWTAGGTMRNVPVGAGRRKNKNVVASQFHHIAVPEAFKCLPNVIHHPGMNPNGTVLTFSSNTPLCESMASVLNIADKSRNGFHQPGGVEISVSHGINKENGDDHSSGSSVTASSSKNEVGKTRFPDPIPNHNPFHPQVPVFHGGPLPYPWNVVPWTPPNFGGPSTFPPPFPYWGCAVPGTWNIPWIFPSAPTGSSSGPNSLTLGKHSRDNDVSKEEGMQKTSNPEKCLWAPKTLRIDDPGEAAKSSIWATLGIRIDERVDSFGGHGLFKGFQSQSKGNEKTEVLETSDVLKANPAAFSRSLSFRESS